MLRAGLAVLLVTLLAAVGGQALGAGLHRSAARAGDVRVYFTDGEKIYAFRREVSTETVQAALNALLEGPNAEEVADGVETWIPPGTRLNSVRVRGGIASVDLGGKFLQGTRTEDSLRARLVQVVFTVTQFPAARAMRLLVDGRPISTMGQGVAVKPRLTRANVDRPQLSQLPPTSYVEDTSGPSGPRVRRLQQRLVALGYMPRGAVTGHYGPQTTNAVLAFQGWEGLTRDGDAGPQTFRRLQTAKRPTPLPGRGKRTEVRLRKQVVLLVNASSRVVRTIHVSSGKPSTPTPPGRYRVYRKAIRDWSYPFQEWLPYASYFDRGIAFHEFPQVPPYPASHGCVRVPRTDARTVYVFATLRTPVRVVG